MAAAEPLEPESRMNREELYDALVGLCQQVGITTEATHESLHNAVDSILDEPNEELVHEKLHVHDEGHGQFRHRSRDREGSARQCPGHRRYASRSEEHTSELQS